MTTDDLRTRARAAAEEAYRKPRWHVGTVTDRLIEAFYEGYLAHAAQQPTRELAAHDQKVKAAVLREMAEDWMHSDPVSRRFRNWLLDTADLIESEARP